VSTTPDGGDRTTADVLFHATLLQATGNEIFAALSGVVGEVSARRWSVSNVVTTPDYPR
jgi:DNA-binding FadR family transcriptional regulator